MVHVLASLGDLALNPYDVVCRLVLASVLGAAVGWERRRRGLAAGRTLVLVALGAALFVVAAEEVLRDAAPEVRPAALVGVMGGLIGGVGFLGAGAILHHEDRSEGVTTAAAIWVTSGLGVTCGLGEFVLTAIGGASVLITLLAASPRKDG